MHWIIDVLQKMGETLEIPVFFVIIEFIGTFAFALSGIRLASAKRFDIFGAWIVGMATAIGGGTIRDLMLGMNPFWMTNSIYFICCGIAVLWVWMFGRYLIRQENTWFIFDTIGLALFNVIGIEKTLNMGFPYWTAITMGCVTGAAGGVIRDVFINEVPLIFRKEIYALACVAGGIVYAVGHDMGLSPEINALLSSATVIIIRILAVKFHWHLPVLRGEEGTGIVALLLLLGLSNNTARAQHSRAMSPDIQSLRVIAYDNPVLPPMLERGKHGQVEISFDEMSHEYHRYIWHIEHCNADWTTSEEIFESDYLEGLNDQPIENYEKSFNTTQLYTHYSVRFPNEEAHLRLSGNYRVLITEEDNEENGPVAEARFCIYEKAMNVSTSVSGNTDIDFNDSHQQLTLGINYGSIQVVDPDKELHTVIMQNWRQDNALIDPEPNVRKSNGLEYTHRRELIFSAGNEYHKFEVLNLYKPGMNVDHIRWYEPYYHVTLFEDKAERNYIFEEDQDGASVLRREYDEDNETCSEYMLVHFTLRSPKLSGGDLYVHGRWANTWPDERCLMQYNEEAQQYEAAILLKQGYYEYEYLQLNSDGTGNTAAAMGNFYETENEYAVLVYHRAQGARYDRLVGYSSIKSR